MYESLHTAWSIFLVIGLGLGPGTLIVRRLALPPYFWVPITGAASSVVSYALFWVYLFHPQEARTVATLAYAASLITFGVVLMQMRMPTPRELAVQRDAWLPVVLMVAVLMTYLGCLRWATGISEWQRFTITATAVDHLVPRLFADRLYNGLYRQPHPPPLLADEPHGARTSDRPPLQAAMLLAVRPLQFANNDWTHQVVATTCQVLWVPALYALGRALRLQRRQLNFALIAAVCSGFFLFHSLYVWPKLYAAWLFLIALALVIHHASRESRERWTFATGLTIGALFAVALLAHGGIVFSFLALPLVAYHWKLWTRVSTTGLMGAALGAVLLLTPWLAYQRFYDPPGDRLIKLHLAGVTDPEDTRSALTALVDAYTNLAWSDFVAVRWSNLQEQGIVLGKSGRSTVVEWVQWQQFFHHLPALDFVLVGFAALFMRRRADDLNVQDLRALSWYAFAALLLWIVVMFLPNSALIHHGSYATTALLFFCGGALLATLPSIVGTTLLAAHVLLFAVVWLNSDTLTGTTPRYWSLPAAGLMLLALIAFFVALRFTTQQPRLWKHQQHAGTAIADAGTNTYKANNQ